MKIEYRRNLPHLQYVGATFFITFRLKGSRPAEVVGRLSEERQQAIRRIQNKPSTLPSEEIHKDHKRYFVKIDAILDRCQSDKKWLLNPQIAGILIEKIKLYDGKIYDLIAYCIMPNPIYLVVDFSTQLDEFDSADQPSHQNYKQLFTLLQQIKGSTAYQANKILKRTGSFWQPESYDHFVRDQQELKNIVYYTLQNPVKAGLVEDWRDWPFTFLNEGVYGF